MEYDGKGVNTLKKALAAGRFDSVPMQIQELEQQMRRQWAQMRREWVRGRPLSELADSTQIESQIELVNCYFFDAAGKPDKTLTPDGLAVPVPRYSTYRVSLLADAVGRVPGLMSKREGDTMLIAWDETGIAKARERRHAAVRQAEEARRQAEQEREQSRTYRHEEYLRMLGSKTRKVVPSPIGQYLLQCKGIEDEWPETKEDDMTLTISISQPGVYDGSFNVDVAEGPMKLSEMKEALPKYIDGSESDEDNDEDEDSELEEDNKAMSAAKAGQKRKGSELALAKSQKPKLTSTKNLHFHTVYRSRETGEGEINPGPMSGYLTFEDDTFSTFTGSLDMDLTSYSVVLHGRKISDVASCEEQWEDYGWGAHEYARSLAGDEIGVWNTAKGTNANRPELDHYATKLKLTQREHAPKIRYVASSSSKVLRSVCCEYSSHGKEMRKSLWFCLPLFSLSSFTSSRLDTSSSSFYCITSSHSQNSYFRSSPFQTWVIKD